MINSDGIIVWPVSVYDISKRTRRASDDLGVLCGDNPMINKFAKYKPVRYAEKNTKPQLNADKTWKDSADWWRGDDGKCGLNVNVYDTEYKLTQGFESDWGYLPPRGKSVTPKEHYRQIDFNYYNHSAQMPFRATIMGDAYDEDGYAIFYITNTADRKAVFCQYTFPQDDTAVKIEDLKSKDGKGIFHNYDDLYVGVLMTLGKVTPTANAHGVIKINPKPIGTSISRDEEWGNGYNRTIYLTEGELNVISGGTWYVYPFITPNGVRDEGGVDVPINPWNGDIGKNITSVPPAFGLTSISLPTTQNGSTNPPIVIKSSVGGANCTTTMTISNLTWYTGAFKFKFTIVATNSGVLEFTSTSSYHIYVLDPDDTNYQGAEGYYQTKKILGERSIGQSIYIDLLAGASATYTQTTWDSDATDGIQVATPYVPADRPQTTRLQVMVVSDDGKVSAWEDVNYR
ncbi:MAG: hypothetical protein E7100_02980 [Bacteroidaceae bacterium]|nr:hypothetical protein [Bacteroidaceae bacterium]